MTFLPQSVQFLPHNQAGFAPNRAVSPQSGRFCPKPHVFGPEPTWSVKSTIMVWAPGPCSIFTSKRATFTSQPGRFCPKPCSFPPDPPFLPQTAPFCPKSHLVGKSKPQRCRCRGCMAFLPQSVQLLPHNQASFAPNHAVSPQSHHFCPKLPLFAPKPTWSAKSTMMV